MKFCRVSAYVSPLGPGFAIGPLRSDMICNGSEYDLSTDGQDFTMGRLKRDLNDKATKYVFNCPATEQTAVTLFLPENTVLERSR